jgi:hypothetical protein
MSIYDFAHIRVRFSLITVGLGLLLAVGMAALWIFAGKREYAAQIPPETEQAPVAEAPPLPPQPPAAPAAAPPPRFAAAPPDIKRVDPELGKDTPFDSQELHPPKRFRRNSTKVRDARLNELIAKANLDSTQTQKLLDFTESTNKQLDQAYNEIVLPSIPSTDPAQREQARVAFMRSLIDLSKSYDQLLAALGPEAQNAAKSMRMDMTNLLTPEQSYQLRSFLKRFGQKHKMDAPAAAPETNM